MSILQTTNLKKILWERAQPCEGSRWSKHYH